MQLKTNENENSEKETPISSAQGVKQGCPLSAILFSLFTNDIIKCISEGLPTEALVELFMLLFADDMAIFTESATNMRRMIKNLEKYTKKWGMKVNLDKTKIVMFRKTTNKITEIAKIEEHASEIFTFNGTPIEYVESYRYLGLNFHQSGTWTQTAAEAKIKGLRLTYKLKEKLRKCPQLPVAEKRELFVTCVQNGSLYGAEIWGFGNFKQLETIQANFAKFLLKVRRKTPNSGALGELGLMPYQQIIIFKSIKFWIRIVSEKPTLLYKAYQTLRSTPGYNWCLSIKKCLNQLGFSNLWTDQDNIQNPKQILNSIWLRIKDNYTQIYDQDCQKMPRLTILSKIKEDPCRMSEYLQQPSSGVRTALTRIRLSSHNLEIEKGRWTKPKATPRDQRICQLCQIQQTEDELHFMTKCPKYDNIRPNFLKRPENVQDLADLLGSRDRTITVQIGKYMTSDCYP